MEGHGSRPTDPLTEVDRGRRGQTQSRNDTSDETENMYGALYTLDGRL